MGTYYANPKDFETKNWRLVDAKDQIVGRLASRISRILMGKDKTAYTPHVDCGDGVIVVNASKVRISGTKAKTKLYKNYSGYPSGLRERTFERVMKEEPTFVLKSAVKGMLPKSRLGRKMITHLLLYAGNEHPHSAQKPKKALTRD